MGKEEEKKKFIHTLNDSNFKKYFDSGNHILSSIYTTYGYNVSGTKNLGSFKLSTKGFQGNQYVKMNSFYPVKFPRYLKTNLGEINLSKINLGKINLNKINLSKLAIKNGVVSTCISGLSAMQYALDGKNEEAYSTLGSMVNGYYFGSAGAEIGAAVGACFGPIGAGVGFIIGGIVGGYIGGEIGKKVGSAAYNIFVNTFGDSSGKASGTTGSGDTGGIEFSIPRIIPEFKDSFSFNTELYISFKKYSSEAEQEVLNLVNNKLLVSGEKFETMDQVFSVILNELSIGYLVDKKLPFISLNFNKEGLLYPIMDEYYKHTLVGCIITMLDYYLKCYVNGGFFSEEFIYEWQKTKNIDKLYLDDNFNNMKMYLLSIYGDKNKIRYQSLNDMIKLTQYNNEKQIFLSAFRIIGKMDSQVKYHKNLILPECNYDVEYDLDISPDFKASAMTDINKQKIIDDNEKAHKLMALRVKYFMNLIPHFKPYFELLKIITFCLHYLPNIQACGSFPDLSNNVLTRNKKYIPNIPHIFPPLPIKKNIEVEVSVTMKELIHMLPEKQKKMLNNIIRIQFLELDDDLNSMVLNSQSIEKEITIYMNRKIKKLLCENDNAYLVDITSDNDLNIPYIIQMFSVSLSSLICHKLRYSCENLSNFINQLKATYNYKNIHNNFDLEELLLCRTIKNINKQVYKLHKTCNLISEEEKKRIMKEHNEKIKKFRKDWEKERNEKLFHLKKYEYWTLDGENKIKEEFMKKYDDQMKSFNFDLEEKLKLKELKKYERELKNEKLKLYSDLENNTVIDDLNERLLDIVKFEYSLTLQSLEFDLSPNVVSKIETRGGCLVKLNKNLILVEEDINKDLYKKIINKKSDDYYCIKSRLINCPVYGDSLSNFVKKNYDLNKNQLISSTLKRENKNIKDLCGFSKGHYKVLLGDYQSITSSDLNSISDSGIRPELVSVTMGNIKMVSKLIKLSYSDFSSPSYNDITPLLMALLNKDKDMINLLLDYPYKIGDINHTNELQKTYLHYACEYNMPDIAKRIIQLDGKIDSKDRKNGNSPLHLICQNANIETLKSIIDTAIPYINIERLDGKTPLHISSYSSILCTKLLLRYKANPSAIDAYGNSFYDLAIYSGRLDCYQQLPDDKYNKKIILEKIMNPNLSGNTNYRRYDKVEYLQDLFKDGNFKEIERIILSIKKNLPFNDFSTCLGLINAACKGRNNESIKYLSQLIDFKKYLLMPFIGKYGLNSWIKEAIGYGCDLYESNRNIDNGATIFDWCIKSNDSKMLTYIFNAMDNVDEKLNSILSKIICEFAIQGKLYLLSDLQNILELPKFKTIHISIYSLCKTPNITSKTFIILLKVFKCIDTSTIDLKNAIQYCRPGVFREMLKLKPNLSVNDWKTLEKLGKSRDDNLSVLAEFYPIKFNKMEYSNTLISIEDLMTKEEKLIEQLKQKKLNSLLKLINIGLSTLTDKKMFLPHLICDTNSFWAIKCLPDTFAEYFFIKDEEQNYSFDYILPSFKFTDDLSIILDYFDSLSVDNKKKANYILLCLDIIIIKFNEIPFFKTFEFDLNKLLKKYEYIFDYSNINNENIFFIISKSTQLTFDNIFHMNSEKININQQNVEGNTILMNAIKNKNLVKAQEIINKFNVNFALCNNDGDSYLHLLFKEDIIGNSYDDKVKILYDITQEMISRKPSNILLQNRKGETPYILASRIGCNTALHLMSLVYPPETIEKYSINTSALHEACYFNKINTVRYLIESLHYNVNQQITQVENEYSLNNFTSYSTPLHCAAKSSSLEIFKLLLQYGANPFIKDSKGSDAVNTIIEHGNKEIIKFIINSPFILKNNYNNLHLLSMVKNTNSEEFVKPYIISNAILQFNNISDENMNNLLMISCINDKPSMVNLFIDSDINIESQNKNGNNILHLCCYSKSVACATEILSKLEKRYVDTLLRTKNNDGDTPLHIASEYGLLSMVALFLSYMDERNKEFIKNNNNLSPIQQSIKFDKYDITLLYMEFYNFTLFDIEKMKIPSISFEVDRFKYYYINECEAKGSEIRKIYKKMKENRIKTIEEITHYKINDDEAENNRIDYYDYNTYEGYYSLLSKIYKPNYFNEKIFIQYQSLLGHLYTLLTFKRWHDCKKDNYIDKFMMILSEIDNNKNSLEICELFFYYTLMNVDIDSVEAALNEMYNLVYFCNNYQNSQYFVQIVNSMMISYIESKIKINVLDLISTIKNLRRLVESDSNPTQIIEYFKAIKFNISPYQFIKNLLKMCSINNQMKLVQIKYANQIPPLLAEEVDELIQEYPIIHKGIYSILPIDHFVKYILNMKDISASSMDISLKSDQYIKNSQKLNINEKIVIFESMIKMLEKTSVITEDLFSFVKSAEIYIVKFREGKKIEKLIDKSSSFNEVILKLNELNELPEFNFDQYNDQLNTLLARIEFYDKSLLRSLAQYFNEYYIEYSTNKNYGELGRQLGLEFKESPTIKNMAKLLAIITRGFEEALNFTPYLIQILAISSFLLHYTKTNKNHGRIAQIKTGEGKSMIIAILALSNALMGYFVDVITSTHYLSQRDQQKFQKLFSLFGVSSSNITRQTPLKEDYNGIILYGTNTDFEFTLLREGIFIQNKNQTQPLDKDQLVNRKYHVAIVDECDNLFLDTALNSARIAYSSDYHYNWVYDPIFQYVKNSTYHEVYKIRQILRKFEGGIHQKELIQITDDKLKEWIKGAKIALKKTINNDYIVGFNEELQKKEVLIISSDTGRVQYGSRWSGSIHEFVEVKEGLIPEEESSIIGSISHPTYFQNYQTIFGLTGTVGEEIEKDEIRKIYDIELYQLPRNFKERLIIETPEILETKELKHQKIIDIIHRNILKQPMLIIMESIQESLEFSNKLRNQGYQNSVLNDAQKEKEEYILQKAGEVGNILISTNAAGRGTDIVLSQEALHVGGLYVILGFFPQNSRIEYQGIGRAGRQGQPGRAKIVFSEDEPFVQSMASVSNNTIRHIKEGKIKYYYLMRNIFIKSESERRIQYTESEKKYYGILCDFFDFKQFLLNLFKKPEIKHIMGSEMESYYKFLMSNIDQLWANYYSEKVSERSITRFDDEEKLFTTFLEYFLKEIKRIQSHDSHYKDFENNVILKIIESIKDEHKNTINKKI